MIRCILLVPHLPIWTAEKEILPGHDRDAKAAGGGFAAGVTEHQRIPLKNPRFGMRLRRRAEQFGPRA